MHIYCAGIGGIAIGPMALLLKDIGHTVTGSDKVRSRYSDIIVRHGIKVSFDQSGQFLKTVHQKQLIDWYVHTAAMPQDHPELTVAEELGIKTTKRDELINLIIKEKDLKLIAVSGTHGKTTTTAMLIWLFDQLKIPFAHLVGTNLSFSPSGRYQKGAKWLIYEADEYDRNMLRFHPDIAVITKLDYDHPDTYLSVSDYIKAFQQFLNQSKFKFLLPDTAEYLGIKSSVQANPEINNIKLPGLHNRQNAWLAISVLDEVVDLSRDEIREVMDKFPGSERRFEKLINNLYTDYAHHPTEIRATLQLAREIAGNRQVVAIYQPHQNIRQHEIADQYGDCFAEADKLYWLPTYLSREYKDLEVIPPEQLLAKLIDRPPAEVSKLGDELANKIRKHLSESDLVLLMSAGDADAWLRENFG